MAIPGQVKMGCDWIEGAAFYGYFIKYQSFSRQKIGKQTKRGFIDEIEIVDNYLFKTCWKSFCQWNSKVTGVDLGSFSCILGFADMPGLEEKRREVHSCHIIFGHEFRNGMKLSEMNQL